MANWTRAHIRGKWNSRSIRDSYVRIRNMTELYGQNHPDNAHAHVKDYAEESKQNRKYMKLMNADCEYTKHMCYANRKLAAHMQAYAETTKAHIWELCRSKLHKNKYMEFQHKCKEFLHAEKEHAENIRNATTCEKSLRFCMQKIQI